jgi:hypothetical protein
MNIFLYVIGEIARKNSHLALRSRPSYASAAKINTIRSCNPSGCSDPLQRSRAAPSPSASPRRDLDLSLRVLGSRLGNFGARIRLSVRGACRHPARSLLSLDPIDTGELHRHDALLKPRPRPRGVSLLLERQHSCAPLLNFK